MATPVIAEAVSFDAASASATPVTGAGTLATDVLLVLRGSEDDGTANLGAVTGDAGCGTPLLVRQVATVSETSIEGWTIPLTSGGAHTITVGYAGSGRNNGYLFVIRNPFSSTPADGSSGTASQTNATSWSAASISPVGVDDLLFGAWEHRVDAGSALTLPGAMNSNRYNIGQLAIGVETLAASGATGTRSASGSNNGASSFLIAVRGGAGSTHKRGSFAHLL